MSSGEGQEITARSVGARRGQKPEAHVSSQGGKELSRKNRRPYVKHGNKRHQGERPDTLTENKAKELHRTIEWQKRSARLSHGEAVPRRVFERPEFHGVEKVMVDIDAAITNNRFAEVKKLIEGNNVASVREYIRILFLEHAKTLLKEKDGEHLVACVSQFYLDLQGFTVPKELPHEIIDAINQHIVTTFKDRDQDEIMEELGKFGDLGLLKKEKRKEIPELENIMRKKLLTYFAEQDPHYANFLRAYFEFTGKELQLDREMLGQLTPLALAWVKNDLENWSQIWEANDPADVDAVERDPRAPLVRLSTFLDDLQCVSVTQVRQQPELLKLVRKALAAAQSYEDWRNPINPPAAEGLRSVHKKFWKNPVTRFFPHF